MADINSVAQQFAEFYYSTFKTNRAGLQSLYRDSSMLTFESDQFLGASAITQKLAGLPFQETLHTITTLDAQPFTGGILVMITGDLKVDGGEHPIKFSQTFSLIQEGGSFFVQNDLFRLNYG